MQDDQSSVSLKEDPLQMSTIGVTLIDYSRKLKAIDIIR